jgi:hypothetical protein
VVAGVDIVGALVGFAVGVWFTEVISASSQEWAIVGRRLVWRSPAREDVGGVGGHSDRECHHTNRP